MILRWQDESDTVYGDRWIILIAYIIGLSIGVHLLNLLCIPAIVLVFYYQKYRTISLKGAIAAIALSGLLIVLILLSTFPEWRILEDGSNYSLSMPWDFLSKQD